MSFLPRLRDFGLGGHRAQEAELQQRVHALQSALENCKGAAKHVATYRRSVLAVGSVVLLAVGFALGVYKDSIVPAGGNLVAAVVARPAPNADAAYAKYQRQDYDDALKLAQPLAEAGDVRAQSLVGLMYYRGRGPRVDPAEAVRWFRAAADGGDAAARFYLGVMFAEGRGVPQDYEQAAIWYQRAADLGDAQALYNLGLAYAQGEGVSQDNVTAHMLLNVAAARFPVADSRARSAAVSSRDVVAAKLTPEQLAEAQKLAREWQPR
jgi:TPR repeat protein